MYADLMGSSGQDPHLQKRITSQSLENSHLTDGSLTLWARSVDGPQQRV
jgi:hypothetical protein